MFVDNKYKNDKNLGASYEKKTNHLSPNNFLFIVLGVLIFVVFAILFASIILKKPVFSLFLSKKQQTNKHLKTDKTQDSSGDFVLPGSETDQSGANNTNNPFADLEAEKLAFGMFYKKPKKEELEIRFKNYDLPINIKTDVVNYFKVYRKISLDPYIDNFNKNGFSFMDANFNSSKKDFFSMYREIASKGIPLYISDDFIFYYYQNNLKQVFKDVEQNVFYDNLWKINRELFNKAMVRYGRRLSEVGEVNDAILEAERMEAAYFAVALNLLQAQKNQVDFSNYNNTAKFNKDEAITYSFATPLFLKESVDKELKIIRSERKTKKSPILLFPINYSRFNIPSSYNRSAKLKNFYLTTKWLTIPFPLYYKDESCPNCLLDYDDWKINFLSSALIAYDMYEDQDLKNRWATIYKIISFFRGLRSDLTYLDYNRIFSEEFGNNYNIEEFFKGSKTKKKETLLRVRDKIADIKFADIQGPFLRDEQHKPFLGMRILQEPFWPNDYLLNFLVGKDMPIKKEVFLSNKELKKLNKTNCGGFDSGFRCRPFSLDVINLYYPVRKDYPFFRANTAYYTYDKKVSFLQKTISSYDDYAWNANVYWMTLDITKNLLDYDRKILPVFMQSDLWQEKVDFNTVLGAWTNIHLGDDVWRVYEKKNNKQDSFNFGVICDKNNFIEPNIVFIKHLIAKNNMLIDMFDALKITKKTNTPVIKLSDLNVKLEQIISIIKKQLSGTEMSEIDCSFLDELTKRFQSLSVNKSFQIKLNSGVLSEGINGVRPLGIIYQKGEDKIMAIGPVFNYQEK